MTSRSVLMKDSVVAESKCEVMILSRELFMKALNGSRSILKRRAKEREKRASIAANAAGQGAGNRASVAKAEKKAAQEMTVAQEGQKDGGEDTSGEVRVRGG